MMYQTPLRKIVGDRSVTYVRASFGLHKIGAQEPYCSLTGEEYSRAVPTDASMLSCGQIRDVLHVAFPELDAFARWHLCANGIPMHYIANAKYWHEMANGKLQRRQYDPDPRETFVGHCLLGVLKTDPRAKALLEMSWEQCQVELVARSPELRAAFETEVVGQLEVLARKLGTQAL